MVKEFRASEETAELSEKVLKINRVSKVAKGGRRFSFSAVAVVGNQAGLVAVGLGKANEVPDAVQKAIGKARRNLMRIHLLPKRQTLAHDVIGKYKASSVILRPAAPGTGLIADEAVRSVLYQAGVHDALTKVIGSKNTLNVVRATMNALEQLEIPTQSARKRNVPLSQIFSSKKELAESPSVPSVHSVQEQEETKQELAPEEPRQQELAPEELQQQELSQQESKEAESEAPDPQDAEEAVLEQSKVEVTVSQSSAPASSKEEGS